MDVGELDKKFASLELRQDNVETAMAEQKRQFRHFEDKIEEIDKQLASLREGE